MKDYEADPGCADSSAAMRSSAACEVSGGFFMDLAISGMSADFTS
jgi:hypothetical protein